MIDNEKIKIYGNEGSKYITSNIEKFKIFGIVGLIAFCLISLTLFLSYVIDYADKQKIDNEIGNADPNGIVYVNFYDTGSLKSGDVLKVTVTYGDGRKESKTAYVTINNDKDESEMEYSERDGYIHIVIPAEGD